MVTGSRRLDTYRRVGDSLMGRCFLYHMHPFSVAETLTTEWPEAETIVRPTQRPDEEAFAALWDHGGLPEPFLKRDSRFSRFWQTLRGQQLLREDVRDLTQIQQLDQLEMLVQNQLKAPFAFQVVIESDYIDADCFAKPRAPLAVPARTLLSQLL